MHALGLAVASLALLAVAAFVPLDAPPLSLFACPFRAATGLPCLTCGASHAFAHLVHGHPLRAVSASPLGALLALVCAVHVLWTLVRLCGFPFAPRSLEVTRPVRYAAFAVLLANWTYLVIAS